MVLLTNIFFCANLESKIGREKVLMWPLIGGNIDGGTNFKNKAVNTYMDRR